MKLKKLNMRGLAHVAAPLFVMVLVAIAGVAFLVGSHADSCNSGPKGRTVTTSCAASQATATKVNCNITGVPAQPTYKQVLKPKLAITNDGHAKASIQVFIDVTGFANPNVSGPNYMINSSYFKQQLAAGHTSTHNLKQYKVPYATEGVKFVMYRAQISANDKIVANCSPVATLPNQPK